MSRTALVLLACVAAASAQPPSLDAILARAGEYVIAYHDATRLLVFEEQYVQILRPYGSTVTDVQGAGPPLGQMGTPKVRKTRSEIALLAVSGTDGWQAYRDTFEIDGRTLHTERGRLERALTGSAGADAASRLTRESLAFDLASTPHDLHPPAFPLVFLMPHQQAGVRFVKKGDRKVEGFPVAVVEYAETAQPLARLQDGTPQPSRGELWIDPVGGAVVRTKVIFDSMDANPDMRAHPERYLDFPRVTIEVVYRKDTAIGGWVPIEMKEFFDRRAEVVTCTATYSKHRRVEVVAR